MGLCCANCGYDNDPTRVYCHNCGLRLEHAAVSAPAPTGFSAPAEVQQKIHQRKKRKRLPLGMYVSALVKLVTFIVLVAASVLAFLPPEDVPATVAPDETSAARVSSLITDSASASGKRSFAVPSSDLVNWLVTAVKFRGASGAGLLQPERLYAVPGNGDVRIGLETSLPVGPHLYFEGVYAPRRDGAGFTIEPKRYSIGRLPLPSVAGIIASRQFAGLADALSGPLSQLSHASDIVITPATTTLTWSGRAP